MCASLEGTRGKSLRQLCVDTKLPAARCAKILHALLRHGCVKPCIQGKLRTLQTYRLDVCSVLQLSRAHLYLQQVRKRVGQAAERICLCLLLRGRLTAGDIDDLLRCRRTSAIQTPFAKNVLVDMHKAGIVNASNSGGKLPWSSVLSQKPESTAKLSQMSENVFWSIDAIGINNIVFEDESISCQLEEARNPECRAAEQTALQRASCTSSNLSLGNFDVGDRYIARKNGVPPNGPTVSISGTTNQLSLKSEHETNSLHSRFAQTVVRRRFGEHACRIFRLLCRKPQLEQKQISEASMIPLKDCREILGKLLKHEYVRMQEVARTTDHAPSRTNYLWKVHLPSVVVRMKYELEDTLVHLKTRLNHEVRREQNSLRVGSSKLTHSVTLSSVPRGRSSRVDQIATSILRIEKTMLMFTS